jgi:hypothetical protein
VETNETIAAQKRQRLEALEKRRQEQEVRKAEESEKLKQERAQLLLNKLYTVAERNKLVQQAFENRCQMQLKDMAHKQQLYFERRKNNCAAPGYNEGDQQDQELAEGHLNP